MKNRKDWRKLKSNNGEKVYIWDNKSCRFLSKMKSELEFSGDMWFLDIWKAGGKYMIHRHLHGEITFYPCLFPTSRDKHMTFLLLCCCCKVASVVSDPVRPHRWQPTRLPHPWDSLGKNTGVGCHFLLQCMKVKSQSEVAQSCLTLSDPMDYSLPGCSVHGIFQARVLLRMVQKQRQSHVLNIPLNMSIWVHNFYCEQF